MDQFVNHFLHVCKMKWPGDSRTARGDAGKAAYKINVMLFKFAKRFGTNKKAEFVGIFYQLTNCPMFLMDSNIFRGEIRLSIPAYRSLRQTGISYCHRVTKTKYRSVGLLTKWFNRYLLPCVIIHAISQYSIPIFMDCGGAVTGTDHNFPIGFLKKHEKQE